MKSKRSDTKRGLVFGKVKSGRFTAYGIFTDTQGNRFEIRVVGTNQKQVEKYIRYQKRQSQNGKGIQIRFERYSAKTWAALDPDECADKKFEQKTWDGLSINIHVTCTMHRGVCELNTGDTFTISKGQIIDYPFDNRDRIKVECTVTPGNIKVQLFEFTDYVKAKSVLCSEQTINAGNGTRLIVGKKRYTGNWNLRLIGVATNSPCVLNFKLMAKNP
ncbi:MAG: hypothetical protein B6D41_21555 [Chloroflexi bacterium UTCFX4]|jgi:hypothetical protein|nr:MAG: hypothetical protein B6D41_21555 [Chloroflexi bacterium UTCFX4]